MALATRLADMRQRATNKQQYVLPIDIGCGVERLKVFDNRGFDRMKRAGWLPRHASYLDLVRDCVYITRHSRINKTSSEDRAKARARYFKYAKKYLCNHSLPAVPRKGRVVHEKNNAS